MGVPNSSAPPVVSSRIPRFAVTLAAAVVVAASGLALWWGGSVDRASPGWWSVFHWVACFGHAAAAAAIASLVVEFWELTAVTSLTDVERRGFDARESMSVGLGLIAFMLGCLSVYFTWNGQKSPFSEIRPLLAPFFAGTAEIALVWGAWLMVRQRRQSIPANETPMPEPEKSEEVTNEYEQTRSGIDQSIENDPLSDGSHVDKSTEKPAVPWLSPPVEIDPIPPPDYD